jgi:anaerobic selenocysteine-containing dehydrogenase
VSNPHWGGTGTTNFATNQVATGTSYVTGGPTLTQSWSNVAGVPTLRATIVTIAQDAANTSFSARWGIIYNSTDANKRALAFIDLGSDRTISAGSLTLDWSGATDDILTITQS